MVVVTPVTDKITFGTSVTTVTTSGSQSFNGPVTLNGASTSFTSSNGSAIMFGGSITGTGTTNLTVNTTGVVTFGSTLTSLNVLNVGSSAYMPTNINLAANVTTTGVQTYYGMVTLPTAATMIKLTSSSATGGVTFENVVSGASDTLNIVTPGIVVFDGNVTLASLTVGANGSPVSSIVIGPTSPPSSPLKITTTSSQSYYGPMTLNTSLTATGTAILFGGTISDSSTVGLTVDATTSAEFDGNVNNLSALMVVVTPVTDKITFGTSVTTVTTSGSQSFNGLVILNGASTSFTSSNGSAIMFGGSITGTGTTNLTVNTTGVVTFGNTLTSLNVLNVGSSAYMPTNINLAANVTTTGVQTYYGMVTLPTAATTIMLTSSSATGGVTFEKAITNPTSGDDSLVVQTPGGVTFNGAIGTQPLPLAALTVGSVPPPTPSVAPSAVTINGAVYVSGALQVTASGSLAVNNSITSQGGSLTTVSSTLSLAPGITLVASSNLQVTAQHGSIALTSDTVTSQAGSVSLTAATDVTVDLNSRITAVATGRAITISGGTSDPAPTNIAINGFVSVALHLPEWRQRRLKYNRRELYDWQSFANKWWRRDSKL